MRQKVSDQRHEMLNIASHGNVVFTERVDYSCRNDKWTAVPLVAVFELRDDGKITAWREYLDLANTSRQQTEEHTSELQSLMRISYAVFCLKKKKNNRHINDNAQLIDTIKTLKQH